MTTTPPTFAQLAESTLDDLLNAIPDASGVQIERTSTGDIVVWAETRIFHISGKVISVRNFASKAERFEVSA